MTTPTTQEEGESEDTGQATTPQLDRLEKLANAAAAAAQAKQWRARKNGMQQQEEPSEGHRQLNGFYKLCVGFWPARATYFQ
jgi:hypothetical protein